MKTHELADALFQLAQLLKASPNTAVAELQFPRKGDVRKDHEIAVNLATLSKLSQIDKQQWMEFVVLNNLPIELRPRDASRDILGKLLRYLDENPEERNRLKTSTKVNPKTESPELAKALSFLLGEQSP